MVIFQRLEVPYYIAQLRTLVTEHHAATDRHDARSGGPAGVPVARTCGSWRCQGARAAVGRSLIVLRRIHTSSIGSPGPHGTGRTAMPCRNPGPGVTGVIKGPNVA